MEKSGREEYLTARDESAGNIVFVGNKANNRIAEVLLCLELEPFLHCHEQGPIVLSTMRGS